MRLKFLESISAFYETVLTDDFDEVTYYSRPAVKNIKKLHDLQRCASCGGRLSKAFEDSERVGNVFSTIEIDACSSCNWWIAERQGNITEVEDELAIPRPENKGIIDYATLRRFDITSKKITWMEITREINKNPSNIRSLNPYVFERYVAEVFRSYFKAPVEHVGKSNDGGVDLFLLEGEKKVLVQVKRRSKEDRVESVETIRDLLGAMFDKESYHGIIVSTADRFSRVAIEKVDELLKRNSANKLERLDLIDCNRFLDMVDVTTSTPQEFWKPVLSKRWHR